MKLGREGGGDDLGGTGGDKNMLKIHCMKKVNKN